jgi:hypothetical protein
VGEPPREEFEQARANLWFARREIAWRETRAGVQFRIDLSGGDGRPELVLQVPHRPWPAGSYSLLWRGVRLFGLDLNGPAHRTTSRTVPTPHFQYFGEDGSAQVDPIELATEHIENYRDALRWFLKQCGLDWQFRWHEPPTQGIMGSRRARPRTRKRR